MNEVDQPEKEGGNDTSFGLRAAAKLFDATVLVVVLTAALYFFGYIYYAGFTERLGVYFRGISLPIQEYLVASWTGVIALLIGLGGFLCIYPAMDASADWLLSKLMKRFWKKSEPDGIRASQLQYLHLGLGLLSAGAVLFIGANVMLVQGRKEAEGVLKLKKEVLIRSTDGKPIEGRFIYLRDFGNALLVREMSADMNSIVGSRWLKEGSYSGYTLLESKTDLPAITAPSTK